MNQHKEIKTSYRVAAVVTGAAVIGVLSVPFADASTPALLNLARQTPTQSLAAKAAHQTAKKADVKGKPMTCTLVCVGGAGNWRSL